MIAIAGCCQCNGIKRSCIESNHRQQNNYHNNRCTRHRFDDRNNHAIQISVLQILRNKVSLSSDLHSHRIVPKYNKTCQCRTNTKYVTTKNCLTYCSTARNAADKKRSSHTPNHPVSPIVDRPILREVRCTERVSERRQINKVLDHSSKRRKTGFNNIPCFSTKQQNKRNQAKEHINTNVCQLADSLKSMQQGICIYSAGNQKNNNVDYSTTNGNMEQFANNGCHKRCRYTKCCSKHS